jgi:hypothetical protein
MATKQLDRSWRVRLTRDVGWWFIAKLGLLTLLWAFFFSGSHRCIVDGPAAASRLSLGPQATYQRPVKSPGGDRD